MNCKLSLQYEFSQDGDDFGWLAAHVDTPSFGGRNGMWVQWQNLLDFASSLKSYPIQADTPSNAQWGVGERDKYTEVTTITIAPMGSTGGLAAHVSLANYYSPTNKCCTQFETDYPSIARFGEEIERMIRERNGRAVLVGSTDVR